MSFQDKYDDRFFRNGQVVGVNYGGSVHQPTVTYSNIPNLGAGRLPDPGPRYGESRLPKPRYSGDLAGAFMNLPYFGESLNPTIMPYYPNQDYGGVQLLAGSPSFDLNYGRGRDGTSLEGIPNANDPVMRQKLRNRLLKNPAGTESLPGFLRRV